jgi:hypothetical protein
MSRFAASLSAAALGLIAAVFAADSGAQPLFGEESTADGLFRIDPSIIEHGWLRPDVDLSQYTHAFVMPTVLLFRDLRPGAIGSLADTSRSAFPVDEKMRERLRLSFGEAFHRAMSASRDFETADRLGRNVVLVQAYVTDIATGLPPDLPGSNIGEIRWLWEGDLILELRDAMSDQVLLRTLTRQRVDGPVEGERLWSLAPRVTAQWSQHMVEQLALVSDFFPSHLWRMNERAQGRSD